MGRFLVKWGGWGFQILGSIALFLVMHMMQKLGGLLPSLAEYCRGDNATGLSAPTQHLEADRWRWTVVFVGTIIMVGMLLPEQMVGEYPQKTVEFVSQDFDAAWKAVYGKDLFREFSLHKHLMQYTESLAIL